MAAERFDVSKGLLTVGSDEVGVIEEELTVGLLSTALLLVVLVLIVVGSVCFWGVLWGDPIRLLRIEGLSVAAVALLTSIGNHTKE